MIDCVLVVLCNWLYVCWLMMYLGDVLFKLLFVLLFDVLYVVD